MKESVSFIVIAHQNAVTLSQCLASAEGQSESGDELILVLNNPDPQTKSEALKHQRWLILYEASQGPQFARNTGGQRATKSILCFLDSDIVLPPGWRYQMLQNFKNPWVAIGQSKICKVKNKTALNWLQRYQLLKFNARFYFHQNCEYKEVELSLDTATMMVRKEWFHRVGGFDSDLARLEDTDFSLRVMYYGGDIFFEDRISAIELEDENEGLIAYLKKYLYSSQLVPLLNAKHYLTGRLPLCNRKFFSKFRRITFSATFWDLILDLIQILGLATSPHPLILSHTKYIELKADPKKMAWDENADPKKRSIWVGGKERFYNFRAKVLFRQE